MKLLTVVVSLVAALAANGKLFSGEDSALQAQQLGEIALADVDGHEMYKPHNDLNKEKKRQNVAHHGRKKDQGQTCEASGGECMKKRTIFNKCKTIINNLECGNNGVCCMSGLRISIFNNNSTTNFLSTIENTENSLKDLEKLLQTRMNNLESSIESMMNIISNGSRMNDLENSMETVMNIVSNESRMNDLENSMESMVNIITDFEESQECPEGFFKMQGSRQCYKFFNEAMNWDAANAKCISEGLLLAKPNNPVAVRKYLQETYGDGAAYAWIGLRGDGSVFRWQQNGPAVSNTSPFWCNGHPGGSRATGHCVILLNNSGFIRDQPRQPYHVWNCSHGGGRVLCELV